MNRRKLFSLLGLGTAGTIVGAVASASTQPKRWENMSPEERTIFRANCKAAWDTASDEIVCAEYPWHEIGFEWNPETGRLEYFDRVVPIEKMWRTD